MLWLAYLIKAIGNRPLRGKARLIRFWMDHDRGRGRRIRRLPGGARIECDLSVPYEAMIWLEQEEETELQLLHRLLRPGQVFVDCGANIGTWTLVAAARVGTEGQVVSFEPNPETFARLADHVNRINDFGRLVRLFPAGVSDQPGRFWLEASAAHNVSQLAECSGPGRIAVEVTELDRALAGGRVHGIKLDVEGFELRALKGAGDLLATNRPWLCLEFNTILGGVNRLDRWDVHRFLVERGYCARRFEDALRPSAMNVLPGAWETSGYVNLFYSVA